MKISKTKQVRDAMTCAIGIEVNGVRFMTTGNLVFDGTVIREESHKALDELLETLEFHGYEVST